jgi:hypothetical protein
MKGTFYYKRDFTGYKFGQLNLFDLGGNARSDHGQMLDQFAEWNVAANLNNNGLHSHCNGTVCTMTESITVNDGSRFGYGICPGEMVWSYTHMHAGAIHGLVHVNGKEVCQVLPRIGVDPNNSIGNEQGYLVGLTECVNLHATGQSLRLNKGDVITATASYDVDEASTSYFPAPGGKHGGIMALFFSVIVCDAGTWSEIYVRRNDTCVGTPRSKSDKVGTFFNTLASCEAQTDPQAPTVAQLASGMEEKLEEEPSVDATGGQVTVAWRDCGSAGNNVTQVTPETMGIGNFNNLKASGVLTRDIESATFTVKMASGGFGMTLLDFSGDACHGKTGKWTLDGQIHLTWQPMKCPLKAGEFASSFELWVDPAVPVAAAHTTSTIMLHDQDGEEFACVEVVTTTNADEVVV